MGDSHKPSLRIDWFDGTLMEDTRPTTSAFEDEDQTEPETLSKPVEIEKKAIGFKRLLDLSLLSPPILNLEIANRPGFWLLLENKLKGDFIVLIVKILANIYKSLQPGEKSKISTLLRVKLEKSEFLNLLKNYFDGLPKVRIVEKKMNLQLWNDVETFFFDVLELCNGIFKVGTSSYGQLQNLLSLLEGLETSATGVQIEHSEIISEAFYSKLTELKSRILLYLKTPSNEQEQSIIHKNLDLANFRNLQIFPKKEDLIGSTTVDIRPNIVNGAYPSVEDYLDLQFKLLREDCFGPLREGIVKYLDNPLKKRHENLRIYPKVRVIRTYVSSVNKVGHLVDISWNERLQNGTVDNRKHACNKRLMFGSLLLFTSDNFKNIICASVLESSIKLLSEGYIAVSFQSPVSSKIFAEPYLMVESEVFFEPYHRVLNVLQNSAYSTLPMKKYIVDVQIRSEHPAYLTSETVYSIHDAKKSEDVSFPVLDINQWPSREYFGLDESQMEAYTFALTREFAVIQGPPGTGKTFIGTKIASTLLNNLSLEGTPLLILCYTNHALDQFLEGILNVTTNVIRLGSQSKSALIEPYTLNNVKMRSNLKYSHLYSKKRKELHELFQQMTHVQNDLEKCENELISYKCLKPFLKDGDKFYKLKIDRNDAVLDWLFSHIEDNTNTVKNKDLTEALDDWEQQLKDMELLDDKIETCFSEQNALREIDELYKNIEYVNDISQNDVERERMKNKIRDKIKKIDRRLECFRQNMILVQCRKEYVLGNIKDLYELTPEMRWQVYYSAVDKIKEGLMKKLNSLVEQHTICSNELDEVSTLIDGEVMRTARVVGVTTTVAARRHDLLRNLLSPIVIVEEAAEVLEAHIVASLTDHCQHLILIGDHKQLRPTAAHYVLAKRYNLDVSLFERMIRNNVHARTLLVQRRMRPSFVRLLVPAVYDRLECHPSVLAYPDVRGMKETLYFYSHTIYEDSECLDDSWSHRNAYEARWCLSLANYLRRMNYTSKEIIILSTYTGQNSLINEMSRKYKLLDGVKITVVDNYQGEESRIVILSLVRSNRDGKIGFLTAANRICVALSRAKEGFYIFGNMDTLKSASPIWRSIDKELADQNAIGNVLALSCAKHRTTLDIHNPEDLDAVMITSEYCLKKCCDINNTQQLK